MLSHAQVPTPLLMDGFMRIFFTTRHIPANDKYVVSNMGYVDVETDDPTKVIVIAEEPVLPLGNPGCFDEFGIMPGSVLRQDDKIYMYYTGWSRGYTVPYITGIGLAVSEDNGMTFRKTGEGPILGNTYNEPYLENGPYVIWENNEYHIWYASGTKWLNHDGRYEPVYITKYGKSVDNFHWDRTGAACFEDVLPNESNGRPSILKIGDTFHMWFCYRASVNYRGKDNGYRMGYASSTDLKNWKRDDSKAGIDISETGWDAEMVAYPQVIRVGDKLYMFYNGNYFGKEGFGYAEAYLKNY